LSLDGDSSPNAFQIRRNADQKYATLRCAPARPRRCVSSPANLVQIESPVPTITPQISSFLLRIYQPKPALRIRPSQIQLNIKPRFPYFLHSPPRPPQTAAASFKSRYRKSSALNIRRRLYITRLGLPMNASDFWVFEAFRVSRQLAHRSGYP